jgi:hypothetical protein
MHFIACLGLVLTQDLVSQTEGEEEEEEDDRPLTRQELQAKALLRLQRAGNSIESSDLDLGGARK